MLFIRKNLQTTLESLKLTRSTKLLENIDVSRTHIPLKALTGLVRSLNSDVKADQVDDWMLLKIT